MESANKETEQTEVVAEERVEITLKSLIESGAHFGGKTRYWNPKAAPHIYGARNGIYIMDIDTTIDLWRKVHKVLVDTVSAGGMVLMVSTKHQSKGVLSKAALECGAPYVEHKWNAGNLTNFSIMRKSVRKLRKYEQMLEAYEKGERRITKKEMVLIKKRVEKLDRTFGGLRKMTRLPDLVFVTDCNREDLAVKEANLLNIPVISLIDSDSDPTNIAYPLPANDDARRSVNLFIKAVSQAIQEGTDEKVVNEMMKAKESLEMKEDEATPDAQINNNNTTDKDNIQVTVKKS